MKKTDKVETCSRHNDVKEQIQFHLETSGTN